MSMIKYWCIPVLLPAFLWSQEAALKIAFRDLDESGRPDGPKMEYIENSFALEKARRSVDLGWSNPEFTVDYEVVESGTIRQEERITGIAKRFDPPWTSLLRRRYWNGKIREAENLRESERLRLQASRKAGYVRISLLRQKIDELNRLEGGVSRLRESNRQREREGMMSGTEKGLIDLSLLSLYRSIQENQDRLRRSLSEWKIEMGIPPDRDVELITTVRFSPVDSARIRMCDPVRNENAGLRRLQAAEEAGRRLVLFERSRIWPGLSLNAGRKTVDGGWKGFVAGLSLEVPLFNWNRGKIGEAKAVLGIASAELEMARWRHRNGVEHLKRSIAEIDARLRCETDDGIGHAVLTDGIKAAYTEGFASMKDYLNSVQIAGSGIDSYFDLVSDYYDRVFELEMMTGARFDLLF